MNHLLRNIERMTRERDRPLLEAALASGLCDLLDTDHVSIVKLQVTATEALIWTAVERTKDVTHIFDDGLSAPDEMLHLQSSPLMADCLQRKSPQTQGSDTVLPVLKHDGSWFGFVLIAGKPLDAASEELAVQLTAIFCNMVALLDYSEVDSLTGLFNRKTFDGYLLRILSKAAAGDAALADTGLVPLRRKQRANVEEHWLGVLDIDHFKRINDKFGHMIGDEVLLLVATMMKNSFRAHDKLFRFGGEEFVVLLKPTEDSNAMNAFDRFRAELEAYEFPQVGRVTISIGFARIGPHDQYSKILDNADEALYWAKEHGRNQVVSYEALVAAGSLEKKDVSSDVELF